MSKEHAKKIAAPVIIAVIVGFYYIAVGALCLCIPDLPAVVKILLAVITAALTGTLIYVLIQRIKEIRSGEEDDLSKY